MTLSRIVMRLARNPGTEFADGDDHRGYSLVAPLGADGKLDVDGFQAHRGECSVRRFAPEEEAVTGVLKRRGQTWYFDYDASEDTDDEPVHRLGEHSFTVGEYVSVADEDGRMLAYKVTEVSPLR
ncbi:MAG: hypothetical protein Q7T19_14355 [Caulobacter sp.]|nr:hypothetical protein [Caulobacter sp.]